MGSGIGRGWWDAEEREKGSWHRERGRGKGYCKPNAILS